MNSEQLARAVVAELVKAGVTTFVLCPGSRSAPLAYALRDAATAGVVELHVETDERVAGFVALGSGIAGSPAAVVTTSGSAVANLHPAVEEAAYAGVPMVVLAADRPHEMRGVRASQTADHRGVLEASVRFVAEIPAGVLSVRGQVRKAVHKATGCEPGPVLINVAFRDPLMPSTPWEDPLGDCTEEVPQAGRRPVVIAGPATQAGSAAPTKSVPQNMPILAEPTSPLRGAPTSVNPLLLRSPLRDQIDTAIVVGHPTLSREVTALLADPKVTVYAVDEPAGYTDVAGTAWVVDDVGDFPTQPGWVDQWLDASQRVEEAIEHELALSDELTYPAIARIINAAPVPTQLAASSIIREVNLYGGKPGGPRFANRGLAGIDGTMSTALGLAIALGEPVRVVVGDLAFVHDAGALIRGVENKVAGLDVVVVDDHGGSLFATLEYGKGDEQAYDQLFRTERGIDVQAYAKAVGAKYVRATTASELAQLVANMPSDCVRIVHVDLGRTSMSAERGRRAQFAQTVTSVAYELEPRGKNDGES
ncbi:2-succinyl-5-enolpyruvyl-6-hydroxy-3-cyclohexene-1-carboxylic-acid synthase [Trueperella bialowiezensis]|uniref:2-succinyl-5-enolpyruvyl-6-hydroxy-3-cyclohexene-1-carboxylate synthase n=1 Tax=Trueperella bialowiezensis TaxID=312285 RepID=A0A3S4VGP8_9ACTO|nr:2-succinyl-5-enolpyruvyl-6-hydroxy-3-cyclohexene-1-carboxylic-acid synthase [Trueperella bialowiezensis]VEI13693.1 2-succinyl-5-enolpyruvyl-6-hydroxy-3-cyclohexene-1-carboxylate synthase [Trueperella bialowiezensis]